MEGSAACLEVLPVQEVCQTLAEISLNPLKNKTRTARETERIHMVGLQIPGSRGMAVKQQDPSRAVSQKRAQAMAQELALGLVMAKAMEPQRTPPRTMLEMVEHPAVQRLRQPRRKKHLPQRQANTRHLRNRSLRAGGNAF
jgi:hypothetical protein